MAEAAPTRLSLLIRLKDKADADAWSEFVEIYSPLVYSIARRCNLQDSDAAGLVQEVMTQVAQSIERFEYDPQIGKFRSWLYKIAKRTVSRSVKKQARQPKGTGDTAAIELLNEHSDGRDDLQDYWNREYRQHLIDWAAEQIRDQFQENTWRAFWMTSVEEKSNSEVAKELGMSVGSVYVAKSRVMKRLAERIREIDDK